MYPSIEFETTTRIAGISQTLPLIELGVESIRSNSSITEILELYEASKGSANSTNKNLIKRKEKCRNSRNPNTSWSLTVILRVQLLLTTNISDKKWVIPLMVSHMYTRKLNSVNRSLNWKRKWGLIKYYTTESLWKKVEKGFQFSNALFFSLSLLISQRQREERRTCPLLSRWFRFKKIHFTFAVMMGDDRWSFEISNSRPGKYVNLHFFYILLEPIAFCHARHFHYCFLFFF